MSVPNVLIRARVLGYSEKPANRETGALSEYGNLHVLVGFDSCAITYPLSWTSLPPVDAQVEVECAVSARAGFKATDPVRVSFMAREITSLKKPVATASS